MGEIKNFLLYSGVSKEEYEKIKEEVADSNRKMLSIFLPIVTIAMFGMFLVSFLDQTIDQFRFIYAGACGVCLAIYVIMLVTKKNRNITFFCLYSFVAALFAFGIALGTYFDPEHLSATIIIMFFAVPLCITDRNIRIGLVTIAAIVTYVIFAYHTQSADVFSYNLLNVVPYGIVSVICSSYMMKQHMERYNLIYKNRYLSETDQLTGMLNRHSYAENLKKLSEKKSYDGVRMCALDINGLKKINDTLGHMAGDDLIKGAAHCIEEVFGPYGKCYRIGGDEFMVIIEGFAPHGDILIENINKRAANYRGVYVRGFSIATGYAIYEEGMTIEGLIQKADVLMYANKNEYYKKKGE